VIGWRSLTLDAMLIAMMAASVVYLYRVRMPRPPVGRFTPGDIAIMSVMLIVLPAAYLRLPAAAVSAVFGVVLFTAAQATLAPLVGGLRAAGITALPVAAEIAARLTGHAHLMLVVNNGLIIVAVVGVVNMWAQTGMSAAHVAALATVLTCYDVGATWLGALTQQFLAKVAAEPFLPMLAVVGGQNPGGFGLGDCLVLAMWPVVLIKAFGKRPAWLGAVIGLTVAVLIEFAFHDHWVGFYAIIPTMSIVGPLIIIQYAVWRRRLGRERTTAQWRAGVGRPAALNDAGPLVDRAIAAIADVPAEVAGEFVAVAGGSVVAAADTPGAARRAARVLGIDAVPVVMHRSLLQSAATGHPRPQRQPR
jgi:hypothetical protein